MRTHRPAATSDTALSSLLARLAAASPAHPVPLGDYDVTGVVGRGGMGAVYEATHRARGTPVALKTVEVGDASAGIQLKREFRVVADLAHPNLAPVYELAWAEGLWFFVMQRVEGVSFVRWARGEPSTVDPSDLPLVSTRSTVRAGGSADRVAHVIAKASHPSAPKRTFAELRAAFAQLVRGVRALHDVGLRHGDLKPSNVLVHDDGSVTVVDFGLTQALSSTRVPGGTPLYMAPELLMEEEGEVGPWSDWYALGAMLYQALTGRIPSADSNSIVQLVYARASGPPPPAHELVPETPRDLSDVCNALLSPVIEERPGADELLQIFAGDGAAIPRLTPRTTAPSFVGRQLELRSLEHALARARSGERQVAHVHGTSGIGKSTLVSRFLHTVKKLDLALVLRASCYERESVPYKAFDGVVDEMSAWLGSLEEGDAASLLPRWIEELAQAFPALATVPAVQAATAKHGPLPDAKELHRRTRVAFAQLLKNVSRDRTVVIFIDDLQWTDADSAELLEALVSDASSGSLMILVSYRERAAAANPALERYFALCQRLAPDEAMVDLPIESLPPGDAETLAAATLRRLGVAAVEEGSAQLAREAGGMPFFIEVLARFVAERGSNVATVEGASLDHVSLEEALAAEIDALPPTQRALVELVAVADRPVPQSIVFEAAQLEASALPALLALCSTSILHWTGAGPDDPVSAYHDRIRESVLSGLDERALERRHLALGRRFAARCGAALEDPGAGAEMPWLFDAVRHLEGAEPLIDDPDERHEAAQLHLAAGDRARRAAAYPLAQRCFESGLRFLPRDRWTTRYELTEKMTIGAAEQGWLVGDFDRTRAHLAEVYANARETLDRAPAWRVDIAARIARRDLLGAIDVARGGLRELGVDLPEAPTDADVGAAVQRAMAALGDEGAGRLEDLPELDDPSARAAMTLLVDVSSSAYYAAPALLPIIAADIIVASLEKGPCSATPFGLAVFGIVLNAIGMQRDAHEIGQLAFRMIDRWEDRRLEARTRLVVHNNVCSWTVPLEDTLDDLLDTYRVGRANGDFEFAAIAAQCWATNAFVAGRPLAEVEERAREHAEFMRSHQQNTALILHRPLERLVACFRGHARTPGSLSNGDFDEEATLAAAEAAGSASVAFVTLTDMLVARFHFASAQDAWELVRRATPFMAGAASTHHLTTFHTYAALSAAQLVPISDGEERDALLQQIDASVAQLEAWSATGPANFAHRVLITRAERERVAGDPAKAAPLYERALEAVGETAYVNDEALIAELAAGFHIAQKDRDRGRQLLVRARDAYRRWGATAKVGALDDALSAVDRAPIG